MMWGKGPELNQWGVGRERVNRKDSLILFLGKSDNQTSMKFQYLIFQ